MFSNGTWTQLLEPTKFSASPEQGIVRILSVLFRTGKAAKSTRVSFLEGRKARDAFPPARNTIDRCSLPNQQFPPLTDRFIPANAYRFFALPHSDSSPVNTRSQLSSRVSRIRLMPSPPSHPPSFEQLPQHLTCVLIVPTSSFPAIRRRVSRRKDCCAVLVLYRIQESSAVQQESQDEVF